MRLKLLAALAAVLICAGAASAATEGGGGGGFPACNASHIYWHYNPGWGWYTCVWYGAWMWFPGIL